MKYTLFDSPLGPMLITATAQGIHHILFDDMPEARRLLSLDHLLVNDAVDPAIIEAREQLANYFAGQGNQFNLPLAAQGTAFQQKVWAQLSSIPYAETWNYGQLALALGQPSAARAVGMANGRNPLSIVVPCHRVIGKNQKLTGYAGGLERKAWLLEHERRFRQNS